MFKEYLLIFRYREMLHNTVRKELRARYKGSVFGFLWTFFHPLLQLVIYSFVFNQILRAEAPLGANYTLWLFVALVPWTCISATVQQSTTIIIQNGALIKKIYFPRLILPLSLALTNLVNMALTFLIVFATVIIVGAPIGLPYLALIPLFFLVFLLTFSISVLLSALTVYFRDLQHIITVLTMLWFYLSPIVYPYEILKESDVWESLERYYRLNPVFGITEGFRDIIVYGNFPEWSQLTLTGVFSILLLILATLIFHRCQRRFAEEI